MSKVERLLERYIEPGVWSDDWNEVQSLDILVSLRQRMADGTMKAGGVGGAVDIIRQRFWSSEQVMVQEFNVAYLEDCREGLNG
jgi:hypothetical protein